MKKKAQERKYLLCFTLMFLSASTQATEVARVNEKSITLKEVKRAQEEAALAYPLSPLNKNQILENLVLRALGAQEAKRLHLEKTTEFQSSVDTLLYQTLLEKMFLDTASKVTVSDKQAEEHYKQSPYIKTSYIFVSVAPQATPEAEKKAHDKIEEIQEKLKAKMPFAEAAQTFSEAPNAIQGGELDYRSRMQLEALEPNYYSTAFSLGAGKTSKILRGKAGYYIIQHTATRNWAQMDKNLFKQSMIEEKRKTLFQENLQALLKKLRQNAKITIKSELL